MKIMTVHEAAEKLGISASTLYDMARQKKISHRRIGTGRGRVLFTDEDLEEFLRSSSVKALSLQPTAHFTHSRP